MRSLFTYAALRENWKSALTVAFISIPLSISLAIASGVDPLTGIITAIWGGSIAALFGGSNYNIVGPTGALSGIVATYALAQGTGSVASLAVMAGIFVILAYAFSLERYLIFVPSSVIHGFILGVACIIALNQLNFALGLHDLTKHENLMDTVCDSLSHVGEVSWYAAAVFAFFLAALMVVRRWIPSLPGVILIAPFGILLGFLMRAGVIPALETLGSKFGTIVPALIQPTSFFGGRQLAISGLVVAFVAILETMLSAKIADALTKTKHNSRQELLGLGLANIASGLAGGFPVTAALARMNANVRAGATSRLSALLSSIFIACGSFLFLTYFSVIPMAVIAAILVHIAIRMVERQHFVRYFHHDRPQFFIAMLVALITVYEDPMIGILIGSVIALLVLVRNLATSYYEIAVHETSPKENIEAAEKQHILVYTFKGKLVYLNSQAHLVRFHNDFMQYAAIVIGLQDLYYIDSDGVDALEEIMQLIQDRRQLVLLIKPSMHVAHMLYKSEAFMNLEREGLVYNSLEEALHAPSLVLS